MERPILFSAPMVRAILNGSKTQTRRVIKLSGNRPEYIGPSGCEPDLTCWGWWGDEHGGYTTIIRDKDEPNQRLAWTESNAAHQVGDTLWAKETWRTEARYDELAPRDLPKDVNISFDADYNQSPNDGCRGRVRQSIFMMRHMSRLHLLVTGVKVERLNDISEADAKAEGLEWVAPTFGVKGIARSWTACPVRSLCGLWESINGAGSWGANPWVVAYTFEVIKP